MTTHDLIWAFYLSLAAVLIFGVLDKIYSKN